MLLQIAGLIISYFWSWSGSPAVPVGAASVELPVQVLLVLVIYLLEGVVSVVALWVFGRKRGRRGFRVLSVFVLVPFWFPLQAMTVSSQYLVPTWFVASLIVALLIRQPESALYGPTTTPRKRQVPKGLGV
jgi:hypothetical protein